LRSKKQNIGTRSSAKPEPRAVALGIFGILRLNIVLESQKVV